MNSAALYRLMAWLSPADPPRTLSHSHGLEWLVETGEIRDAASLVEWLDDILVLGTGRNEAILFAQAHGAALRGNLEALCAVAEYAAAFAGSAERYRETGAQGRGFCEVTRKTWSSPTLDRLTSAYPFAVSYPVAVGAAAADHAIALAPALESYVYAFAANLVSAGIRLLPLDRTDGQRTLMRLEPAVAEAVAQGSVGELAELCSITVIADIAAMKHEANHG